MLINSVKIDLKKYLLIILIQIKMNSEILTIENANPVIIQYLVQKMSEKIEKNRKSQRDRANRWYERHKKVNKDFINENNEVVKFTKGGRPRRNINIELEVLPLIKI